MNQLFLGLNQKVKYHKERMLHLNTTFSIEILVLVADLMY